MFKRLLIPLDGSPLAETALDAAILLAKRFGAEVVLLRVAPDTSTERASMHRRRAATVALHTYLDRLAHRFSREGIGARTVLVFASPAAGIASQVELEQIDLIVMTTHGRHGLQALLHPSITWQVLTQTHAPILACRGPTEGDPRQPSAQLPRFLTDPCAPLLIPLDGSLQAERALLVAQELAHSFGNPLFLVRAAEPVYYFGMEANPQTVDQITQESLAEVEQYLRDKRQELTSAGFQVKLASGQGPAAQLIAAWVQECQAGLIVMASHGRGGLDRLILGSVARSVLGQVQAPILLVHRYPGQDETMPREDSDASSPRQE